MNKTLLSTTVISGLVAQVTAIPNQATRASTTSLKTMAETTKVLMTDVDAKQLKTLIEAIDAKIDKHGAGNAKWAVAFEKSAMNMTEHGHVGNGHDHSETRQQV